MAAPARTFTSQDLVQLPRLSSSEALVLIVAMLTVAKDVMNKGTLLPESIERSHKRLATAHETLATQLAPRAAQDTQLKRKADLTLDNAWSAIYYWLSGWSKLPLDRNPHLDRVKHLFGLLFPNGLAFIKVRYRIEWQESQARIEAITREDHEATFQALGGLPFFLLLQEAHAAYGAALGITAPAASAELVELRAATENALAMLRDYVAKIAAHADPDLPGSSELAKVLLEPLMNWEDAPLKKPSEDAEGTGPS